MNNASFTINCDYPVTVSININYSTTPVCATPVCATPACTTPVQYALDPVLLWAPSRVTQPIITNDLFAMNLSYDMESSEDEEDLVRPEMEMDVNDEDYQEHYTIPEEQRYDDEFPAMEIDGRPHPNVTLFRGNNPFANSDDDDYSFMDISEEDEDEDASEDVYDM